MADHRVDLPGGGRGARDRCDQIAAGDVQLVGQVDGYRLRGTGKVHAHAERVYAGDDGGQARGQHDDPIADAEETGGDLARVAAIVGVRGGPRPDHVLHGETGRKAGQVLAVRHVLQVLQHARSAVPGHVLGRDHHVVAS